MKKVYLIAVIFAIIAGVATYMFATEIDKKTTFKDADMVTVLIPTADIDKNVEITNIKHNQKHGRYSCKNKHKCNIFQRNIF